jgi:ABC-type polysaccharide/polyol phosphate transport system ATPase subunit
MSSELLLAGRGITKIYASSMHPLSRLKQVLFGIPPPNTEIYQVLTEVDLDIFRNETVGIMGRNGAGKTTLLGILGNVIEATCGTVIRNCRMATLLELSAGFNPNFSGRENAYLFCSIQGLSRVEAERRMDGIAAFADLGKYFDLPLRTYSSGMQSRLGFACAIHVDADLVILDETLAVGDASFRVKCYDHIKKMQGSGMTFVLTSHNQKLVANFCTRAIVLEEGVKVFDGSPFGAVEEYKKIRVAAELRSSTASARVYGNGALSEKLALTDFCYKEEFDPDEGKIGIIEARLVARQTIKHPAISFGIRNEQGIVIGSHDTSVHRDSLPSLQGGETVFVRMRFDNILLPGAYFVSAATYEMIGDVKVQTSLHSNILRFETVSTAEMTGLVNLNMSVSLA